MHIHGAFARRRTGGLPALLGALLFALSACTTTEPARPPAPDIPAAWAMPTAAAPNDASKVAWQTYFSDPRLQALIRLALVNNRDLRIAAAKVEQSRAEYSSVRAERLPSVTAQADQSRAYTPSTLDTGASSQRFDLQAVLSYEVDFWGRVAAMGDSARASFLATEEAQRQVRLSLIADVASAYFSLLEKDELLELARATLDSRRQTLELATEAGRVGGADDDERQVALQGLEAAKSALAQLEHQRNVAGNALDFLVGHATDPLPPGKALADQQPGAALAPGLPSEVLLRRPDVMAAEHRLAAAEADIAAARAAFLPKVMLTAALGVASPALATLFSGGAWSYQPVVSLPLFDGGRAAANADFARARRTLVVAEYEKTVQQAFREVADQLSARASLKRQLDAAVAAQQSQAVRLKMARGRYDAGGASLRDVLEAQRVLIAARQNAVALRRAEQESAATLYKVLGGGTDADPPPVVVAGSSTAAPAQP